MPDDLLTMINQTKVVTKMSLKTDPSTVLCDSAEDHSNLIHAIAR